MFRLDGFIVVRVLRLCIDVKRKENEWDMGHLEDKIGNESEK